MSKTGDARKSGSDLGKAGANGARSQRGAFGETDYGAFVADISREQGTQASLTRNYKF